MLLVWDPCFNPVVYLIVIYRIGPVSNVNDMGSMFHFCSVFNSDLSNWTVSNVADMDSMFENCSVFNSDLSSWTVSNVADMDSMFENCSVFNSDLSSWKFNTTLSTRIGAQVLRYAPSH